MSGIGVTDDRGTEPHLTVREPRQQRTREQWNRVLEAGVQLLEEGGYEAFTIAALCERAGVPPRALYARAATKDALFLAVYERGMTHVAASETAFDDADGWGLSRNQRIERAVRSLVQIFAENAQFLRSVVLISGAHPEVQRRGEGYRAAISERFVTAIGPLGPNDRSDQTGQEQEFCFSLIFSAMIVRTAYGPNFGLTGDIDTLTGELVTLAQRYLQPSTTT